MAWRGVALAGAVDVVGWWREVGRKRRSVDGRWKLSMPLLHTFPLSFFLYYIWWFGIFSGTGTFRFLPRPFFTLPPLTPPPHTYPQPKDTICSPTSVAIHSLCPPFPICTEIFSLERRENFKVHFTRKLAVPKYNLIEFPIWTIVVDQTLFPFKAFLHFRWLKGFFPQRSIPLVQTDGLLLLFVGAPTTPQRRRPSCHKQIFWLTLNKSPI